MTNLSKTFDDSFKKEVNSLIRTGIIDMKKEMPKGAVYTSSKKPPKDAQVYRTARGTEYWVPGKKDKEDSKADYDKKHTTAGTRATADSAPHKWEPMTEDEQIDYERRADNEEAAKSRARRAKPKA